MFPYLLLILETLQKIGPLLVLHEVKVVRQMKKTSSRILVVEKTLVLNLESF